MLLVRAQRKTKFEAEDVENLIEYNQFQIMICCIFAGTGNAVNLNGMHRLRQGRGTKETSQLRYWKIGHILQVTILSANPGKCMSCKSESKILIFLSAYRSGRHTVVLCTCAIVKISAIVVIYWNNWKYNRASSGSLGWIRQENRKKFTEKNAGNFFSYIKRQVLEMGYIIPNNRISNQILEHNSFKFTQIFKILIGYNPLFSMSVP